MREDNHQTGKDEENHRRMRDLVPYHFDAVEQLLQNVFDGAVSTIDIMRLSPMTWFLPAVARRYELRRSRAANLIR